MSNRNKIPTSWRFFAYVLVLHLALGTMAYFLLIDKLYYFLPVELLLLVSLYVAYKFYRTFMAPVEIVDQGEASMQDRDFTLKFIPIGSQEVDRIVHLYNSMIDNLRTERAGSQEQHFFLEKLIATAELGVIVLDHDHNISTINDWALQRFRISTTDSDIEHIADIDHPLAKALIGLPMQKSTIIQFSGNQRYRVEKGEFVDRGFPRHFILIQDITRDLLAAEKEAYGKIIRMMAHEVNNSTGATNSLLKSLVDTDDLSNEQVRELNREYLPVVIDRGEQMNRFMRNFAGVIRLPSPSKKQFELGTLLSSCATLFTVRCQEAKIELELEKGDLPVYTHADAAQLEQVVINALTNACESIGENGRIRLTLTANPAGFIVADDGPGIPVNAVDMLFTPFFSTKPEGQGIGLTLSRDVLEQHSATYDLRTDADGWTRFEVRL